MLGQRPAPPPAGEPEAQRAPAPPPTSSGPLSRANARGEEPLPPAPGEATPSRATGRVARNALDDLFQRASTIRETRRHARPAPAPDAEDLTRTQPLARVFEEPPAPLDDPERTQAFSRILPQPGYLAPSDDEAERTQAFDSVLPPPGPFGAPSFVNPTSWVAAVDESEDEDWEDELDDAELDDAELDPGPWGPGGAATSWLEASAPEGLFGLGE